MIVEVKSVDHDEILNKLPDVKDISRKFVDWDNDHISDPRSEIFHCFVVSVLR